MNKVWYFLVAITLIQSFGTTALADEKGVGSYKFQLKAGSFTHHVNNNDNVKYNEGFDNKLLAVGVKISDDYDIIAGSFINSYGDRCAIFGVEKSWYNFNDTILIKGLYAYAGEFFLDQFENCGRKGIYKSFNTHLGLEFAPYLYHGVEYSVTSRVALEVGLILPKVAVGTLKFKF